MQKKRVVFILGTGHCGSTLAELVLGSHPQVFGLGELHHVNLKEPCKICGPNCCPYWDKKASKWLLSFYIQMPEKKLGQYVARVIRRHRSLYRYLFGWFDSEILVDSSKATYWTKRQLRYRYQWRNIEPLLIYVVRDGRAVVNSFLRKYPERGAQFVIEDWIRRVKELNEYFDNNPFRKKMIHYEDFALNPGGITKDLCKFTGIDYRPQMLKFWQHDHHVVGGNAGTQSMISKYRKQTGGQASIQPGEWHNGYYDTEPEIKLDLRWKKELSRSHLDLFYKLTGNLNDKFAFDK